MSILVHVEGMRLCVRTAVSNGPIVHSHMIYESGEPRWNDSDRGKPKKSRKFSPRATLFITSPTWTYSGLYLSTGVWPFS